ncbi:MAG TPA: serine/threonine-protein kinase [Nannocystaceae bacterium]|nr:serine/threonine-protein kinase [Nannocystaceae bacterium]
MKHHSARPPSSDAADPALETVALGEPERVDVASTGSTISRYVVLEEAGRGAMGRVLRAYDPKLQREVAIKEVLRRVIGDEGGARLVAEARAMARLSHPNVVAVHDVEDLDDGRLILVMEYAPGGSLAAWLVVPRPWQEIVRTFVAAGRGLAAAHAAGILHRDFKPANVLVAHGVIKVGDFGLAKQNDDPITEPRARAQETSGEHLTQTGMVMGTPLYMAPEQHVSRPLDAAADQYAFCIALWHALTGRSPFDTDDLVAAKFRGPPTWPDVARARVPRTISSALVRGLSPAPSDRWPSMNALLDVLTVGVSPRRNRWLMAGAGVVLVGGVMIGGRSLAKLEDQRCTGASAALGGAWDATRQRAVHDAIVATEVAYADKAWESTRARIDAFTESWIATHTAACEATTIRAEVSAELLDLRMACLEHARIDLQAVTDVFADADPQVVRNTTEILGTLPDLDKCSDLEALRDGVRPPPAEEKEAVDGVYTLLAQARVDYFAGRWNEAQADLDQSYAIIDGLDYEPVKTTAAILQGAVHVYMGKLDLAEARYRLALELAPKLRQWDYVFHAVLQLMRVLADMDGRANDALQFRELAMGLAEGDAGRKAAVLDTIAGSLCALNRCDEALDVHRQALALRIEAAGPRDDEVASSHNNLGNALMYARRFEEAEPHIRDAVAIHIENLGEQHPSVAVSRMNLGNILHALDRTEAAVQENEQALASLKASLGDDHQLVAQVRGNLSACLVDLGRLDEAEVHMRASVAAMERVYGAHHSMAAMGHANLAGLLFEQKRYEEARELYAGALKDLETMEGPLLVYREAARLSYAEVLMAQGDEKTARVEGERAVKAMAGLVPADDPSLVEARATLAKLHAG